MFSLISSKLIFVKFKLEEFPNAENLIECFQKGEIHYEIPITNEIEMKLLFELIILNPLFQSFSFVRILFQRSNMLKVEDFVMIDSILKIIFKNIKHSPIIREIDFTNIICSPKLWLKIINSIQYFSKLQTLTIGIFYDENLGLLTESLSKLSEISCLIFQDRFSNDKFRVLLEFLVIKKTIKSLQLHTDITTEKLFIMENLLKGTSFLDELIIFKRQFNAEDVKSIEEILLNSSICNFFIFPLEDNAVKEKFQTIVKMNATKKEIDSHFSLFSQTKMDLNFKFENPSKRKFEIEILENKKFKSY